MPSTYIVGYDGSVAAHTAVEMSRRLARATAATVMAANVFPTLDATYAVPYGLGTVPTVDPARIEAARAAANRLLDTLPADVARYAIAGGAVPGELHALARSESAALLAVGVTHRGAAGRLVPGSVAERLVHGAPCPVLVVPEAEHGEIRKIAVAFDGRGEARRAVRAAEVLAERLGASILLISAVEAGPAGIYLPRDPVELDRALGGRASSSLARAQRTLAARFEVETVLVSEPAGPAIVAACEEAGADLLVTGSRGYGPVRSVLLGATSRHLLDHAPCPVLAVPRAAKLARLTAAAAVSA